jgi:hypothetical protein
MDDKDNATGPAHQGGTGKGEERSNLGGEPGRHDTGKTGADRPTGKSTARSSTSINPDAENPTDPSSPNMPPP